VDKPNEFKIERTAQSIRTIDGPGVSGYVEAVNLTLEIPEELARSLNSAGTDVPRQVLETLALEEFRQGRLSKSELRRTLGFPTSYELDGFLKLHRVWIDYGEEDLARERASLDRLGF
jgi:hypothetical protein